MKIEDEFCDECPDYHACDEADDCLIAAEGRKRLDDCTPAELLDVVCPDGPLPPREHEDEAA